MCVDATEQSGTRAAEIGDTGKGGTCDMHNEFGDCQIVQFSPRLDRCECA
jgi:hypothetical protein